MVKVLNHPLITTKLTIMRNKETSHQLFRELLKEISTLMVFEILRDYKTIKCDVETPTGAIAQGQKMDQEIIIVPILRAGLGMVEGILSLIPNSRVGHIGVYRDEKNFQAHEYFYKVPTIDKNSLILLVDPMLATGTSAIDSIERLKKDGFKNINLVCLVGVQEGIDNVQKKHSDVKIFLAAQDLYLNEKKYIIPGLGDAGDRIFGTK
ncbi:uracil phosphoribosyltransferase [Mesomycoplasma lagogenitalium]|uniref:Uracil phosphoribosyltransferase n=1 Tax=Mesomycoplasma lagogenitalium TaxID=171286 RepID=A0ABY8LU99_9BACT|nr:uracil phosphoribosyltransferase [Mesomycoplasma lagogenitalium]WGI36819.1 uracil phosphoribosyltransferase [Mesomycoplasma lagogenitalium]